MRRDRLTPCVQITCRGYGQRKWHVSALVRMMICIITPSAKNRSRGRMSGALPRNMAVRLDYCGKLVYNRAFGMPLPKGGLQSGLLVLGVRRRIR